MKRMVKDIKIAAFDYELPAERIALHPLADRDKCRLLVSTVTGEIQHKHFYDLPDLLPEDALLVRNDTRVINARIAFHKQTGARIEIFLLEPLQPADYVLMFQSRGKCTWSCMVGNLKKWKEGVLTRILDIDGREVTLTAKYLAPAEGNAHSVEFEWDDDIEFATVVEKAGYIPIPPYLKRETESSDAVDYQTVYARIKGSVAAPTAGLHFTPELFEKIRSRGVEVESLTLHVGAGTFQPVKSENIGEHPMHTETFSVTRRLIESLIAAKRAGRPVIAVGTTTVRTLESLPYLGASIAGGDAELHVEQWAPYTGGEADSVNSEQTISLLERILGYMDSLGTDDLTASTSIMIAPGFGWRIVDIMVTNFHQPQSTLLLLVSSFLEQKVKNEDNPRWRELYAEALAGDYRFLSYGDACLLFPLSN